MLFTWDFCSLNENKNIYKELKIFLILTIIAVLKAVINSCTSVTLCMFWHQFVKSTIFGCKQLTFVNSRQCLSFSLIISVWVLSIDDPDVFNPSWLELADSSNSEVSLPRSLDWRLWPKLIVIFCNFGERKTNSRQQIKWTSGRLH